MVVVQFVSLSPARSPHIVCVIGIFGGLSRHTLVPPHLRDGIHQPFDFGRKKEYMISFWSVTTCFSDLMLATASRPPPA